MKPVPTLSCTVPRSPVEKTGRSRAAHAQKAPKRVTSVNAQLPCLQKDLRQARFRWTYWIYLRALQLQKWPVRGSRTFGAAWYACGLQQGVRLELCTTCVHLHTRISLTVMLQSSICPPCLMIAIRNMRRFDVLRRGIRRGGFIQKRGHLNV